MSLCQADKRFSLCVRAMCNRTAETEVFKLHIRCIYFPSITRFFYAGRSSRQSRSTRSPLNGDRRPPSPGAADHLWNLELTYGMLRHVFMYGWRTRLRSCFFFLPLFFLPPQCRRDRGAEAAVRSSSRENSASTRAERPAQLRDRHRFIWKHRTTPRF